MVPVLLVEVGPESAISLKEAAFFDFLVLVHDVLKWLHHPLLKYVMLWHSAEFWHDCLHWSKLEPFPGELSRYFSPASVSHTTPTATSPHVRAAVSVD